MAKFLHTMVRITDPEKSRAFYEALGFSFDRDMDIVRNGEVEATNYFFSLGDHESVLELTYNHDGRSTTSARATATSRRRGRPRADARRAEGPGNRGQSGSRTASARAAR
jgi:Lactoylglutathione lyase and related lyases